MRILYVEDNEVNRALVERVMRARKCSVVFQDEGEGALEALAADPTIDLILLDIELAGSMTGLDVIQTMRERNDHRPVVAVTAYAMMGDRERILEAGCDQYLPKPLVVTDLLNMIDHYQDELAAKAKQKTGEPAAAITLPSAPRVEPSPAAVVPPAAAPAVAPPAPAPTSAAQPAAPTAPPPPAESVSAPAAETKPADITPPDAAPANQPPAAPSSTAPVPAVSAVKPAPQPASETASAPVPDSPPAVAQKADQERPVEDKKSS